MRREVRRREAKRVESRRGTPVSDSCVFLWGRHADRSARPAREEVIRTAMHARRRPSRVESSDAAHFEW
eukprot:1128094-Rhodomonas_salina.1